jgi:hypothetical protein
MKTRKLIPLMAAALLLAAPAMTRAETSAAQNNQQGGNHHQQRDGFMKRIDTNKDGAISKDEFVAAQVERFSKLDKNSNGILTKDEMRAAREMFAGKGKHRHGNKGGKDANNDGDGLLNE